MGAGFDRVTFGGLVNFYCQRSDDNLAANFNQAIFKTMIPIFHG
jgi:hypothetical protein